MAVASPEYGGFRIPDTRVMPEGRAEFFLQAAVNFGVKAVERARARQQYQRGPHVERVKDGEIAVRLFGPDQAVESLERYVERELGPEELSPVEF